MTPDNETFLEVFERECARRERAERRREVEEERELEFVTVPQDNGNYRELY